MDRGIISAKDEQSQTLIREARKKAIDQGMNFSEAMLHLIKKWVNNEVNIKQVQGRNE